MKKYLFIVLVATGLFLAAHTTLAACDPISGTGTGMTGPLVQSMTWAFDDLDQNSLKVTTIAYPGRNCDTGDWHMTIRSDISTLSVSKTYTKTNPGGSLPKTDVSTLDIQILPNGTYPLTVMVSSSYGASVTNTYQITIARAVPGQVIKQNQGQCSSSVDPFVASFIPPLCPFVDGNPPYQPTPTNISEGATITTRIDNVPVPNAIVSDLDTVLFTVSTGNLSSGGHIINAKRTISFNCGSIHYSGFRTAQGIFSCPLQTGTIQFKAETNDIPAIPVSGIVARVVPNVGDLSPTDTNGNSSKSDVPSETYRVSDAVPEIKIINGSEYNIDWNASNFNPQLLPSGGTIQFLAKYKKKVIT
ncbi:MAG: hypothetical protein KBC26_02115, partial [Candidatus Pacebacteria bacterium]|nr:hypothetical protein [Candidatus Paceibacterota bacterium]